MFHPISSVKFSTNIDARLSADSQKAARWLFRQSIVPRSRRQNETGKMKICKRLDDEDENLKYSIEVNITKTKSLRMMGCCT